MTKPTIQELLRNKVLIPASELSEFKEAKALACKIFEDAAFEQYRNQRHQTQRLLEALQSHINVNLVTN